MNHLSIGLDVVVVVMTIIVVIILKSTLIIPEILSLSQKV